jgi:PAT family beta-lactamase induction signal transducer AmpG
MGTMGLGLALQSTLAVALGMEDAPIGQLAMVSQFIGAAGCILGGWLSDRMGRRRSTALFVGLMAVPNILLAIAIRDTGLGPEAVPAFWAACLGYQFAQGLMYGSATALYMDITTPAVAATQFTAYMALSNLASSGSAWWQGHAIERFGYPVTLGLDVAVGFACLLVLPFVAPLAGLPAAAGLAPPSGPGPGAAIPEGVVR